MVSSPDGSDAARSMRTADGTLAPSERQRDSGPRSATSRLAAHTRVQGRPARVRVGYRPGMRQQVTPALPTYALAALRLRNVQPPGYDWTMYTAGVLNGP